MSIIKSPQDSIEAYLYNEINIQLYKELNGIGEKDLLAFFNILFKEFEFFCENKNNYLTIANHFKIRSDYNVEIMLDSDYDEEISSDMTEVVEHNMLYNTLCQLIKDKYPIEKRSGVMKKTCEHIEDVYREAVGFMDIIVGQGSTFSSLLESMSDLDNNGKINKLLEVKYVHLREPHSYYQEKLMPFHELCDLEIQKLKELIENESIQRNEPEVIDLSDTKDIDKILYLQKLGIIDFLRGQQPFTSVPDKVSQILSAITGIKIDSIRPMVRPIINNDLDDSKNPLNSKNAVGRVQKQLINIGFNLNETN